MSKFDKNDSRHPYGLLTKIISILLVLINKNDPSSQTLNKACFFSVQHEIDAFCKSDK